jgi:fatty acid desaturase
MDNLSGNGSAEERRSGGDFSRLLSKEDVKILSQIDNRKFIAALLQEIATIALTIVVSAYAAHPLVYVLAVFILGSRFQAMGILMHDAAHYRAHTHRSLNEVLGEIASFATPFSMQGYRVNHLTHHRELNTDKDPDWVRTDHADYKFPKTASEIFLLLGKYVSGARSFRELKGILTDKYLNDYPARLKLLRASLVLFLVTAAVTMGFWKGLLLYWLLPSLTALAFFSYVRGVAEHYGLEYEHDLNASRTVIAPAWELWLFAPHGTNYHLDHHLYPSVPFYRLKELHHRLMANPAYAGSAHITHGYITGLWRECRACRPMAPRNA